SRNRHPDSQAPPRRPDRALARSAPRRIAARRLHRALPPRLPRYDAGARAARRMMPQARGAPTFRKQTLRGIWSPQLRNRRDVDVYLPPSYDASGRRRYPVVYMHDGQNLSDPATAFAGTWDLEAVLADLAEQGIEAIVVGVHNMADQRLVEYSPFPDRRHGGGEAGRYLAFLIDTLKPRIDRAFRTARDARRTATFGSSMGGLFSLFALLERPDVFALAGIMSPSLWFGRDRLFDFVD